MPFIGEISALAAACLWAGISIIFTSVAIKVGTVQLNIDRMSLAAIFLFITILIFRIDFSINIYQLLFLSISGMIGLVLGDTFLFMAFKEIGPRLAMLIYSINPAIASILAYFFLNERLDFLGILGILVALSGISMVVLEKPKISAKFLITKKGIIYGLIGAFGQAVGLIFAKITYNYGDIHSITATFVRLTSAGVIMLPLGIILKRYKNPIKLYKNDFKTLKKLTLGTIMGPYLGISLSFVALTNTHIGVAATLLATVPIFVLPLSWYFYKEKLSLISIFGAFVTVAGIAILFMI